MSNKFFLTSGLFEFGRYYTTDDRTEMGPVCWQMLAEENDRVLLISVQALDSRPFHYKHDCISWNKCSLRYWLNTEFLETCFDSEEQSRILKTEISGEADKVFVLSTDEAENYFRSIEDRRCVPTLYAQKKGAWVNNGLCYWWLRSQGSYSDSAAFVDYNGVIIKRGDSVNDARAAVRPALWIGSVQQKC